MYTKFQGWVKSFFRIAITILKSWCSKRIWSITITFYRDRDPDPNAILFQKKKRHLAVEKWIFFLFLFLKTFNIQILNLSSGREVFQTSHQRDGFSSVCESDLWRWILSLRLLLVHTTNVFHLYVQHYLNQKESSTGTFPIAFSCWDGDVSFTPTTGNIFKNQIVNNHSTSQNHFYNSKQSTFSTLFPWIRRWCR